MIPDELVGAWARRSIALGTGAPEEPSSVIWVQGRSAYCDLRVPLLGTEPAVECFAGHTTSAPPMLHWSHLLDLAGGPAAETDEGQISWDGDDMVERGVFLLDGIEVPYVEVWQRLPGSDGRVVEITEPGLVHVEVGDHALTVRDARTQGLGFTATYSVADKVVRRLGPDHELVELGVSA
jgi:hypothetical protein